MKKLLNNNFFKSISTLAMGSIVAQVITIIVSPLTTRLFSPEELGIYTLLLSIVSMFAPVICGRYDLLIVTEKDDSKMLAIIKLSAFVTIAFSIFISIGYYVYIYFFKASTESFYYSVLVLFLLLLLNGFANILISYNNREKEYRVMTIVYIVRTSVQNFLLVVLGVLKTSVFGLYCSQVVSQLFGVRYQGKNLFKRKEDIKNIDRKMMKEVAIENKQQPLFSAPAAFANSFSYSSINLFISSLFGESVLGFYSISYRVLGLPLGIISQNVSKVFFQKASETYNNEGKYTNVLISTTKFLIIIAIPMCIGLMTLSPIIFPIVFGESWSIAGDYVVILAPMFSIRFVVSAVSISLIISKRQDFELVIQFVFIVSSILIYFIVAILGLSIEVYLLLISLFYSLIYVVYFAFIYKCSKGYMY